MKQRTIDRVMLFLKEMSDTNKYIFEGIPGAPKPEWWEEKIFNESRLYKALGKEDARSVLLIWSRYRETIQSLRFIEQALKEDRDEK